VRAAFSPRQRPAGRFSRQKYVSGAQAGALPLIFNKRGAFLPQKSIPANAAPFDFPCAFASQQKTAE
jgi:hypothetical protein